MTLKYSKEEIWLKLEKRELISQEAKNKESH
jgi:hypothetical protein